jgi:hypothetical protein
MPLPRRSTTTSARSPAAGSVASPSAAAAGACEAAGPRASTTGPHRNRPPRLVLRLRCGAAARAPRSSANGPLPRAAELADGPPARRAGECANGPRTAPRPFYVSAVGGARRSDCARTHGHHPPAKNRASTRVRRRSRPLSPVQHDAIAPRGCEQGPDQPAPGTAARRGTRIPLALWEAHDGSLERRPAGAERVGIAIFSGRPRRRASRSSLTNDVHGPSDRALAFDARGGAGPFRSGTISNRRSGIH